MILYYSPGACSLADHIALHEADLKFDLVKVDLKTHKTDDGRSFFDINPKGYVPALQLDDGEVLTENVAISATSPIDPRAWVLPVNSAVTAFSKCSRTSRPRSTRH